MEKEIKIFLFNKSPSSTFRNYIKVVWYTLRQRNDDDSYLKLLV